MTITAPHCDAFKSQSQRLGLKDPVRNSEVWRSSILFFSFSSDMKENATVAMVKVYILKNLTGFSSQPLSPILNISSSEKAAVEMRQ